MFPMLSDPAAARKVKLTKVTCLTCLTCNLKGCVGKCRFQSADYHLPPRTKKTS